MNKSAAIPTRQAARSQGFTLIELLITVVVIGILAAIAYPSFMDSIRKSRRSEAIAALNQLQQAQERFRANQAQYTTNLTAAPTASSPGLGLQTTTGSGYYTIAIPNADATSYEATATANTGTSQAADTACAKLGVLMWNSGVLYASGNAAAAFTPSPAPSGSYSSSNRCWGR